MFRDTHEELARLESALLEECPPDIPGEHKTACQSFAGGYKVYNSDKTDEDPLVYSRALLHPQKKRRWPVLLAVFLTLCAAAAYWLLRLWGIL